MAISMFFIFLVITLLVTYWAAKHTSNLKTFYTAGGNITGLQNGLAIAGDFMSAASFLGISGLVFSSGFDGLIYSIGFLVGWPIVLLLIAEPLRNLGKYTFTDCASFRLNQKPIRILSSCGALATIIFYLIAQMVGAGKIIEMLFHINYILAEIIVGSMMVLYVTFGGMLATTWVQIIKAILLLLGASIISFLVLFAFHFNMIDFFNQAIQIHPKKIAIMGPGGLITDPISAISLGLALLFGTAGLPHILMRFFTVKDAKEARKSVSYATGFMAYFYILTFIIGFGAIIFLTNKAAYMSDDGKLVGDINMAAIHLSHAVGGNMLMGFISAVAFATIVAVVSGLTLAGASAISHDLFPLFVSKRKLDQKQEINVSKIASLVLGLTAILLGILFKNQNVAFMVGLAFAIAASANFPVLLLSIYWKNLTSRGAVIGGSLGLLTTILLVVLSSTVWVDMLNFPDPIFPYKYPALFSMSIAFVMIYLFSITDSSSQAKVERKKFQNQKVQSLIGK